MRDDLLDAKASVDWAVSQLPAFGKRINAWTSVNADLVVKDLPPPATNDVVVLAPKCPLPLEFNVEAGAYINVIRSSLDLLATALSARNRISDNPEAHFPIYRCLYDFIDPASGLESVKWLSQNERALIKSLNPYQGGNPRLWSLHQLDIMRKHRRLLSVVTRPRSFSVFSWGPVQRLIPPASGWFAVNDETVLGLLPKDAPKPNMKLSTHIVFDEPSLAMRAPIIETLKNFAGLANSIINLFDAP